MSQSTITAAEIQRMGGLESAQPPAAIGMTIPIVPHAQMRARHSSRNGFSRTYKATEQVEQEELLLSHLTAFQPQEPLTGELLLGVKAFLPIPASKPIRWKAEAVAGGIRPTTKPDLDNLIKHVKDCLTMQRFWNDDRQVVGYLSGTGKYYSDRPRWEIEIVQNTGVNNG